MKRKCIVVVDEQPQADRLCRISSNLKKEGITLFYKEFNPTDYIKRMEDGDAQFDSEGFMNALKAVPFINNLDVFATDYNLMDGLKGFDVLRIFSKIKPRFNKKAVIYSANIENVISEILSTKISHSEKCDRLKFLAQFNVEYLKSEGDFENNFKNIIETEPILSIDSMLIDRIHTLEDNNQFSVLYPFEQLTLKALADELGNNTSFSQKLKNEIVDHLLAKIISIKGYE